MGAHSTLRSHNSTENFWEQYDPPIELVPALKYREWDINADGSVTVDDVDTRVIHAVTTERLVIPQSKREVGDYICNDESMYPHSEYGPDGGIKIDGEKPPVTCKKCLSRMERWLDVE